MSGKDRAQPKGSGWILTIPGEPTSWKREWTSEHGVIRRDYGTHLAIIHPNGGAQYSSEDGGVLTFKADGTVEIEWNVAAALASVYGAGNRKNGLTEVGEKHRPPKITEPLTMVAGIRECFIFSDGPDGAKNPPGLPSDPTSPEAVELVRIFQREAFTLISSIVQGDAEKLQAITTALKDHEALRSGTMETPLEPFSTIAEAIREAALQAKIPPERSRVLKEYNSLVNENLQRTDIRDQLVRMGFGWLPSPNGPPRKLNSKVG